MKVLSLSAYKNEFSFIFYDGNFSSILMRGKVSDIGDEGSFLKIFFSNEKNIVIKKFFPDYVSGLQEVIKWLKDSKYGVIKSEEQIDIIAHRVVHGGYDIPMAAYISNDIIKTIEDLTPLAPLHNVYNLLLIKAAERLLENTNQIAVFDNHFFNDMPEHNKLYALPKDIVNKYKIRRYGYHGLIHRENLDKLSEKLGKSKKELSIISCFLGRGMSISVIENGKAKNISTGFGTFAGLPTLTRAGTIDAAVIIYLLEHSNYSLNSLKNILYEKSGLRGMADNFDLNFDDFINAYNNNKQPEKDIYNFFINQIASTISGFMPDFDNMPDAIVFSGRYSNLYPAIRKHVIDKLHCLDIEIDDEVNNKNIIDSQINSENSKIKIFNFKNDYLVETAKVAIEFYNLTK